MGVAFRDNSPFHPTSKQSRHNHVVVGDALQSGPKEAAAATLGFEPESRWDSG
jgi:hypothetical protein